MQFSATLTCYFTLIIMIQQYNTYNDITIRKGTFGFLLILNPSSVDFNRFSSLSCCVFVCVCTSCIPLCVSWPTCCQWTALSNSDWTFWLENWPRLPTKSCRQVGGGTAILGCIRILNSSGSLDQLHLNCPLIACGCVGCRYADFKRNVVFTFTGKEQFKFFLVPFCFLWDSVAQCSPMIKKQHTPRRNMGYFVLNFNLVEHNSHFCLCFPILLSCTRLHFYLQLFQLLV